MGLKKRLFIFGVFLGGLGAVSGVWGGNIVIDPESRLWLAGDSTLHVYHSTATKISAAGQAEGPDVLKAGAVRSFQLVVPVEGLKSGKSGLDRNMYKALKAKDHPEILFRLSRLTLEPSGNGASSVKADGLLTVAGQERAVTLRPEIKAEDGRLRVEGQQELRMTDFGVKPPSLMLGAVRTKNEVTVHYHIFIKIQNLAQ